MWPHLHFATRAVDVVSGHSCGEKHFILEHPSQTRLFWVCPEETAELHERSTFLEKKTAPCSTFILAVFVSLEELESDFLVKVDILRVFFLNVGSTPNRMFQG